MRRYSPPYRSPPRRGYGGRRRSPPRSPPRRRGYDGHGGRREQNSGSLLVRNVPLNCRPEDLRVPFERFGPVRDVYMPKDYYTGEPRGFAFVQFVDPYDASEAQYHMNGQLFGGREITVVVAAESRKRPEEMRNRDRGRRSSGYDRRPSSYYGRSRSRSLSRSRSPRRPPASAARRRSRSYSPGPRRHGDYSVSPQRRTSGHSRSRSRSRSPDNQQGQTEDRRRSYSPDYEAANDHKQDANGYDRKGSYDADEGRRDRKSPSDSPSGSRSRSTDLSPRRS